MSASRKTTLPIFSVWCAVAFSMAFSLGLFLLSNPEVDLILSIVKNMLTSPPPIRIGMTDVEAHALLQPRGKRIQVPILSVGPRLVFDVVDRRTNSPVKGDWFEYWAIDGGRFHILVGYEGNSVVGIRVEETCL